MQVYYECFSSVYMTHLFGIKKKVIEADILMTDAYIVKDVN